MKNSLRACLLLVFLQCVAAQAGAIRLLPGFNANVFAGNDDGSTNSPIGFPISFYGSNYTSLYVNNNGNVSFDGPLGTFTPFALTNSATKIIAPYFADVDTRAGNLVTYGNDTVDGHQAFGVNWINVGYYSEKTDKLNSFQLVIIDRTDRNEGDFDIEFNYNQVQWETGEASGGVGGLGGNSAIVGYSDGTARPGTSYQLGGSGVPGQLLDANPGGVIHGDLNTSVLGRYYFPIVNLGNTALGLTKYSQWEPSWAANAYDGSGTNIQARGSAVCCLAMALSYSGIDTDPAVLNQLLINANDFVGNNNVNWDAGTRDASGGARQFQPYRTRDAQYLNWKLSERLPVIVGVKFNSNGEPGHFVVVYGKQNGKFLIADPGQADATTLDYYGQFETRGFVANSTGDISGLDVSVADNADVLVLDPQGRLTGFHPSLNGTVELIPQSAHFSDCMEVSDVTGAPGTNTAQQVEIYQPLQGKYQVFLVGTKGGAYKLTLRGFSQDGTIQTPVVLTGTRVTNDILSFQFNVGSSSISQQPFFKEAPWTATPTNSNRLPMNVQFTGPTADSDRNAITSWYWSFGDGTFSSEKSPSHSYANAGAYWASLNAIDSTGQGVFSFGPGITAIDSFNGGLVQNGSFETGNFNGWTVSGDAGYSIITNDFVFAGTRGVDLGTFVGPAYFTQNLPTIPGTAYLISLWLNSPDGVPNRFFVSWNGDMLVDLTNIPAIGWTNLLLKATATGISTPLQLGFRDDVTYLGLDGISVLPMTLRITGYDRIRTNLVMHASNSLTGSDYLTLMGTDLTQPLSQWTPISTNTVDAAGAFTFTVTNAIQIGAPQRYYILRMR